MTSGLETSRDVIQPFLVYRMADAPVDGGVDQSQVFFKTLFLFMLRSIYLTPSKCKVRNVKCKL